jgi:Kef-type K+ transport system membrane component KefB
MRAILADDAGYGDAFHVRAGQVPSILGAFLAGVVVSMVDRDSTSHPHFRTKLEAVGFGFVIPVFFVSSGIKLDLQGLLDTPSALLRVPVFLAALLVMRGVPALLNVRTLGRRPTAVSM